jgi:acetyltransferase-like isoleucine patch superfamily enzyme
MKSEQDKEAPEALGLSARIWRSWNRDSHLTLSRRIRKGIKFFSQLLRARSELKDCNRVGINARVAGRLRVNNRGSIVIGDHFNVNSSWIPIELASGPVGRIQIGDDVMINFGTMIAASSSVSIGSGSMIGPHCIISDVDIPEAVAEFGPVTALPIEIGKDVWLAGRVTIRPGVKIGDGAVVVAGSIVEFDIPPHFMASGIPARLLPKLSFAPRPAALARATATTRITAGNLTDTDLPRQRGTLISDFRLDDLMYELTTADGNQAVDSVLVSGQPLSQMLGTPPAGANRDFAVVWTRPETAVPAFSRVLRGDIIPERDLAVEVEAFCGLVQQCAAHYRYVLLPTWTQPAHVRGRGYLDSRAGGFSAALAAMNLRLMRALEGRANVFVLDASRWQAAVGSAAFNPRGWYLGQMAMSRPLIVEAARDIRGALAALRGKQRKLLVMRFEDAIWTGAEGEAIPSNTPLGQAYGAFQQGMRLLRRRGVRLALMGEPPLAEMQERVRGLTAGVLRPDDFAACSCAEGDEPGKLGSLAAELNIGLEAIVYVDSRDSMRTKVRAALPQVYVPEWSSDKLAFPSALLGLGCFDAGNQPTIELVAANK